MADVDCDDRSVAECFAFSRQGFCQQYATLMTLLLREHGIPARFVQGFLPGNVNPLTGFEDIPNSNGHAWVEVYFPAYGWVIFDPTGGDRSRVETLPIGRQVDGPSPRPSRAPGRAMTGPILSDRRGLASRRRHQRTVPAARARSSSSRCCSLRPSAASHGSSGGAARAARRPPTARTTASVRLAARLGFGPRPTQTAYEYAAALGDVLPDIRPELQTVATAKVEVAYGRRILGEDRIRALRASYRRLRVGLLRLLFRGSAAVRAAASGLCSAARPPLAHPDLARYPREDS